MSENAVEIVNINATINIDNKEVTTAAGSTILEAAKSLGCIYLRFATATG